MPVKAPKVVPKQVEDTDEPCGACGKHAYVYTCEGLDGYVEACPNHAVELLKLAIAIVGTCCVDATSVVASV